MALLGQLGDLTRLSLAESTEAAASAAVQVKKPAEQTEAVTSASVPPVRSEYETALRDERVIQALLALAGRKAAATELVADPAVKDGL